MFQPQNQQFYFDLSDFKEWHFLILIKIHYLTESEKGTRSTKSEGFSSCISAWAK